MKFCFDLDGVIRDLTTPIFGYEPPDWEHRVQGKNLIDLINDKPATLLYAPPTEYLGVVREYMKSREGMTKIITCQPDLWRSWTTAWVFMYFRDEPIDLIYVRKIEDKLNLLQGDEMLIEDYPKFPKTPKVILINRAYNEAAGHRRVFSPGELREIIIS